MRHRKLVAPINSIKHYVHITQANVLTATTKSVVIANATSVATAGANANDVEEGSLVKAIFLEYWIYESGATGTAAQYNFIIEKKPAGATAITYAQMINLGAYPNKKNVLFSAQALMGSMLDGQGVIPLFKNWIMIPKGKQRMGLGDQIVVTFAPTGSTFAVCGMSTYKEYK